MRTIRNTVTTLKTRADRTRWLLALAATIVVSAPAHAASHLDDASLFALLQDGMPIEQVATLAGCDVVSLEQHLLGGDFARVTAPFRDAGAIEAGAFAAHFVKPTFHPVQLALIPPSPRGASLGTRFGGASFGGYGLWTSPLVGFDPSFGFGPGTVGCQPLLTVVERSRTVGLERLAGVAPAVQPAVQPVARRDPGRRMRFMERQSLRDRLGLTEPPGASMSASPAASAPAVRPSLPTRAMRREAPPSPSRVQRD